MKGLCINEKGVGPRKRRGDCASDRTAYLRGDYARMKRPRIWEGTAYDSVRVCARGLRASDMTVRKVQRKSPKNFSFLLSKRCSFAKVMSKKFPARSARRFSICSDLV